jgi:hypothetical protein
VYSRCKESGTPTCEKIIQIYDIDENRHVFFPAQQWNKTHEKRFFNGGSHSNTSPVESNPFVKHQSAALLAGENPAACNQIDLSFRLQSCQSSINDGKFSFSISIINLKQRKGTFSASLR